MIYYLYASSFGGDLWLTGFTENDRKHASKDHVAVGSFECDLTFSEWQKKATPGILEAIEEENKKIMSEALSRIKANEEKMANLRCLEQQGKSS